MCKKEDWQHKMSRGKKTPHFFLASTISKINESYEMLHASQYLLAPSNSKHIQSIRRGVIKRSLKVRMWAKYPDKTGTGHQAWTNSAVHRNHYDS